MRSKLAGTLRMACGPKYDGKYLHGLLRRYLGDTKLDRTLTNVAILSATVATRPAMKPEKNLGGAKQNNRVFFYLLLTLTPPT